MKAMFKNGQYIYTDDTRKKVLARVSIGNKVVIETCNNKRKELDSNGLKMAQITSTIKEML